MPEVLVITDQERVTSLFSSACREAGCHLRVVATLAQGEEEIAAAPPSHAFVQSTISGLTGAEVLHHLRRRLPTETRVVLLGADRESLETFRSDALDLSQPDAVLQEAVAAALAPPAGGVAAHPTADAPLETAHDLLFSAHDAPEEGSGGWRGKALLALALLAGVSLGGLAYHLAGAPSKGAIRPPAPATVQEGAPRPAVQGVPAASSTMPATQKGHRGAVPYLVQPGDNIRKILAVHFGVGDTEGARLIPEIKRLNRLKEVRLLKPGQTLLIPADPRPAPR